VTGALPVGYFYKLESPPLKFHQGVRPQRTVSQRRV
jgi:hypothetical protein